MDGASNDSNETTKIMTLHSAKGRFSHSVFTWLGRWFISKSEINR